MIIMDNIKYNDFENICRTCMYTSDLIYIHDNNITNVLQFLSGSAYSKTDELPQKLCRKCIKIINDIQSFAFKCQQNHLILNKCLNDFKNNKIEITNDTIKTEQMVKSEIIDQDLPNQELDKYKINTDHVEQQQIIYKPEVVYIMQQDIPNNFVEEETIENPNEELASKFECDVCMKFFHFASQLTRHKRMHNGDRPYQCNVCKKPFADKSNLTRHKAIHSDERRYKCDICTKGFKIPGDLIRHRRIHSGKRPHQCEVCSKTFTTKSRLDTHKVIHSALRLSKK